MDRFTAETHIEIGLNDPKDTRYFEASLCPTQSWPTVHRVSWDGTRELAYRQGHVGPLWFRWRLARRTARQFARTSVNVHAVTRGG